MMSVLQRLANVGECSQKTLFTAAGVAQRDRRLPKMLIQIVLRKTMGSLHLAI